MTIAFLASYFLTATWITVNKQKPLPPATLPPNSTVLYESKEQSAGNVTVTVTPQELASGKPTTFEIVFDTHSVDLNFDVARVVELRDDQGNTYGTPVWDGSPPGGHHRKGTLLFPIPIKQTTGVTLTLNDIAGVAERVFTWNL